MLIFIFLGENKCQFIILFMHKLKASFDMFIRLTKSFFSDRINEFDNFQFFQRISKMLDNQIFALDLTDESIGNDSENYVFHKLKSDYTNDFPTHIDRSNINCGFKRPYAWISVLNQG